MAKKTSMKWSEYKFNESTPFTVIRHGRNTINWNDPDVFVYETADLAFQSAFQMAQNVNNTWVEIRYMPTQCVLASFALTYDKGGKPEKFLKKEYRLVPWKEIVQ